MSELRKTTRIEEIDAEPTEPLITFPEIVAGLGWITYHGLRLGIKAAIGTTVLTYQAGKAVAGAVQEHRARRKSISEITNLVESSESAKQAVIELANAGDLELPCRNEKTFAARVQTLVARNDKNGIASMARELVFARQERLAAQMTSLVAESCRAIGFEPQTVAGNPSLIVAKRTAGQTITIDVAKSKEGDVRLNLDANGFRDRACVRALDALQKELHRRGVKFELEKKQPKQQPVFDGRRLPQNVCMRVAG